MTQGSGWEDILEPGETILWQGQPVPGLMWRDIFSDTLPFGMIFTLFSLFWMAFAAAMVFSGDGPLFPLALFPFAGLPFLAIGLYMVAGRMVWDAMVRRKTWYTLTDRTAFVATEVFGKRKLESLPLAEMEYLELIDGVPGDVLFGATSNALQDRIVRPNPSSKRLVIRARTKTGFRRIAEARKVWRLLRDRRAALRPIMGETDRDGTG